jgi:hypothetical protein
MMNQSGFTLVEALTTGVLSTIVAGALVSALSMTNSQIREGISETRLGRAQMVVSEQIQQRTRESWGILLNGESINEETHYNELPTPPASTNEVILGDKDGNPIAKYRVNAEGYLEEGVHPDGSAEWSYIPFRIGEDTVHIDPATSAFKVADLRKSMKFALAYMQDGKTSAPIEESAQCRNRSN